MSDAPRALAWVPSFAQSLHRADDGIEAWDLVPTNDPLLWVVHIRLEVGRRWTPEMREHVRNIVRAWARTNNCEYLRGAHEGRDYRLTLAVKYPSRLQNRNPFEEG